MKRKYANLSTSERREYIDKVKKHNKMKDPIADKQISHVLLPLKAQMSLCEFEGPIYYEPVCSERHELTKMPNYIHCGAMRFEYEPPIFCCDSGKIKLAHVELLEKLYELFTSESAATIQFRKNIRAFISIFSFTSFGVILDKELASAR